MHTLKKVAIPVDRSQLTRRWGYQFPSAYLSTKDHFLKRIEKHHWKNNVGKEVVYGA